MAFLPRAINFAVRNQLLLLLLRSHFWETLGRIAYFIRMMKIQKECSLSESVPFDFAQGTLLLEKTFSK
ncbi:hypothetical protein [Nostoc sp. DSM 114161]|uniref:hypothetical protein n=1 Tax=Nostoc sp. DSM 114161 TaxID=3440143 RepID=UPI004045B868